MKSSLQNKPFQIEIRVYYEDTDTGGVVYYANYLKFFERARTEWLRSLGLNQADLATQQQIMFVVKGASILYQKPARLDDLLIIQTIIKEIRASSIVFEQSAWCNNELLAQADVQVCTVSSNSFKPVRIPKNTRLLLERP